MKKQLCEKAIQAMQYSYSPYSNFCVGAALLCDDGKIYTGCNIENSAFSPTICAERCAIAKAVSDGKRNFSAIAVCGGKNGLLTDDKTTPCGVCRQVLSEFCDADFKIYLVTKSEIYEYTLGEILPLGFKL